MITLTAKINILKDNGTIRRVGGVVGNNISVSSLNDVKNTRRTGSNPFLLGVSKLGSGATLSSGENYFIAENVQETYSIIVVGENLVALTIFFDEYNNQYPQTIVLDGTALNETHTNDNPIFTVTFSPRNSVTLHCSNFTKPDYPLVVHGICADLSIDVGLGTLLNVEANKTDRSNIDLPSYGIISNSALLEFLDKDGEVKEYAKQLLLKGGLKTEISVNDTLVKNSQKKETVSVMYTETWSYNNKNSNVSVTLKDDLEEWQNIKVEPLIIVEGLDTDNPYIKRQSFEVLYKHLYNCTPSKYNLLDFNSLDSTTQDILKNTYIEYPILNGASLWSEFDKLCQVCQLHIYKDVDKTVCCYLGGN